MSEFITNQFGDEVEPGQPRIISLQIDDSGEHFHKIDYKIHLKVKLQVSITFGQPGLFTFARYFSDQNKTIPVLDVHREYDIEEVTGKLLRKRTRREYYCEDGSVHEEIKNPGWYIYTGSQSRDATFRKRKTITNNLENTMIGLLSSMPGGGSNVSLGAQLMSEMSPGLSDYHLSGQPNAVVDFLNHPETLERYSFLGVNIAPHLGQKEGSVLLAKDFISSRLQS